MSFPLLGNDNVRAAVESFIKNGRIPHAIMLEGDFGTGKSTLAHFIAKSAVCTGENSPCGECKQCIMADAASNPDILCLSPEDDKKFISVSQIRALRQDAFIKPHSADRKVFIIKSAELMNEQAQNALLKVLEEPPEAVIFILCAISKTLLLETIQSRCNILSLKAPSEECAVKAISERFDFDNDKIKQALKQYENNIGLALKALKGEAQSAAVKAAEEYLAGAFDLNEYELLKLLNPICENRKAADEFLGALRILISKDLRKNYSLIRRAAVLDALYLRTDYYIDLLNKNINLSLLFSALVSDTKHIIERGV